MADFWIKVEKSTPDKSEIFEIAEILGIDPDAVLGKLIRVWCWADSNSENGHIKSVTPVLIDRLTMSQGFADAMKTVGWLADGEIPNFSRHLGESAKKRAKDAERKRMSRTSSESSHKKSVTESGLDKSREDKSREDKKDKVKTPDQSSIDRDELDWCFEQFWLSGIRKVNKKAAKPKFQKIISSQSKPDGPTIYDLTNQLINDVKSRLSAGQLGFAEMHPTTYLNGERWNDELKQPEQQSKPVAPRSANERVRAALAEKQAARNAAGAEEREIGGQALANDGGHVRTQVCEPVRGDAAGNVGQVLDGDFWPADS